MAIPISELPLSSRIPDRPTPTLELGVQIDRQEQRYWGDVAAQRGCEEAVFVWKATMSANGYVVMGAKPVGI